MNRELINENTLKQKNYNIELIHSILVNRGTWLAIVEGMGCYTMVRKNIITGKLEGLYVNSMDIVDDTRLDMINRFKKKYKLIDNHNIIIHNVNEFDQ
jgi:hypothetical protein